jgi:NAD(P)H dehydrogenase (quinone)
MKVFIVHAHHEPKSFNGAMTAAATAALIADGHEVRVSDLYAMGFDPVSDRRNFTSTKDASYLKQQLEERHASEIDGFSPDIAAEQDKLFWCDLLILQFPLWWFSVPAIMKGWFDRVLAAGKVYGGGKWYSDGAFKGKRAMLSLTMGAPEQMMREDGVNGDLDQILFPLNHGVLYFCGFTVLPSFVVHSPARLSQIQRANELDRYTRHLRALDEFEPIRYPTLDDYDENFVLKTR